MNWNVAQAKQGLSKVLREAEREPQRIYNRQRLVAAVVAGEMFEEFLRWKERRERRSIGDLMAELRTICAEEGGWELPTPDRENRPNPFADVLDDASLGHQRPQ